MNSSPPKSVRICIYSSSLNPPIGERITLKSGISCLRLSIILSKFKNICTSIASKYPSPSSAAHGMPCSVIAFTNCRATPFVRRINTAKSENIGFRTRLISLSNTSTFSITQRILSATQRASASMASGSSFSFAELFSDSASFSFSPFSSEMSIKHISALPFAVSAPIRNSALSE